MRRDRARARDAAPAVRHQLAPTEAAIRFGDIDLSAIAVRGTPASIADHVAAFRDEGIDEVVLYAFPLTDDALSRLAEVVALLEHRG